jgi:asparagine synthase (glutamine-hydrolysing)
VARLGWPGHKFVRYVEQAAVPPGRRFAGALAVNCGVAAGDALADAVLRSGEPELALTDLERQFAALPAEADILARQLYVDWKQTLADNDLRKVNRMTEAAGVQVRYPMLDARVVDASLAVPGIEKLANGKLREFYRETFRPLLPAAVLDKSKHGFGLPFGEWLLQNKALEAEILAALSGTVERGLVRPEFAQRLVESQRSGERRAAAYYGTLLWSLATLEKWLRSHPVGSIR